LNSEIERMFGAEVREKKRTASGVHHKTGKRGYTGVIRFPHEMLKGKAKKEYKGTGKVVKYNMFDTIMKYEDFRKLPLDKQRHLLDGYRIKHSNKKIMESWGLHNVNYYDKLLPELGIKKAENRGRRKGSANTNKKDANPTTVNALKNDNYVIEDTQKQQLVQSTVLPTEAIVPAVVTQKQQENTFSTEEILFKKDGLQLELSGTYTPEQLVRKLEKLSILLDGEENNFKISLSINELDSEKE